MTQLKNLKGVDIIFLSSTDHNELKPNHGLFQMFEFFRDNLSMKSIFVSTLHSIYENKEDVFDISSLGGTTQLAAHVNFSLRNTHLSEWRTYFEPGSRGEAKYNKMVSKLLIENLPEHKLIIVADKVEVEFMILEKLIRHFNSKFMIISAVNNTWTGFCSYPKEYNCDKFANGGCDANCPAIIGNKKYDSNYVNKNYLLTQWFIKRNFDSIYLNVGCSFSLNEANQSILFKDVKKCVIPLKNVQEPDSFEQLWDLKCSNRLGISESILKDSSIEFDHVLMWSAYSATQSRKGMNFFIESLTMLKNMMPEEQFKRILIVVCAKKDKKTYDVLQSLEAPILWRFLDREAYTSMMSACDIYCSTTISDAGPRTTYESAAMGTPIVSFDNCNASDFLNDQNGALVPTYDCEQFALELHRLLSLNEEDKKKMSYNLYDTYRKLMDTKALADKWENFFKTTEVFERDV